VYSLTMKFNNNILLYRLNVLSITMCRILSGVDKFEKKCSTISDTNKGTNIN